MWQTTINNKVLLFIILTILFSGNSVLMADDTVMPVATITQNTFIPPEPKINAKAYILIDANSSKVLVAKNADLRLPPASLTKVMSIYLISKALQNGAINWNDQVRISKKAWQAEGSRMFIKVNDLVSVKDLISGIITASGNDATIAMAEYLASSEDAFTDMLNQEAQQLGMTNSHFTDSTGLPNPEHYATSRDLARLTQAYILQFPDYYPLFADKWFTYNHIKQPNRNRLLWRYPYAEGLKTGHTTDAGFCLIGTANKNGMRLISVIMGADSDEARTEASIQLLNYGFRFYHTIKLYQSYQEISQAKIWHGSSDKVALGITQDLYVTLPNAQQAKNLQIKFDLPENLIAPIKAKQICGNITILSNNEIIATAPLVALTEVAAGSWWRNLCNGIGYYLSQLWSSNKTNMQNNQ
jgi:D-alanyl-D-alanine carboxypeptidase (penicillin-binding protein 5/6)